MALIINKNMDVEYNLAIEEYLLRDFALKEDILFIWYGKKAFVFGRNQNPFIEINPQYLLEDSIPKIRRISGGGTIYEDEGTINFSYITKDYKNKINNYQYFLRPIINLLKKLNLNGFFKPKSHLFIEDVKISGNAQAFINNRLLHHGTILFDSDLSIIQRALIDYNQSANGHHILSNKQPVKNLNSLINISRDEFVDLLIENICLERNISSEKMIVSSNEKIDYYLNNKYRNWNWNFGKTPSFNLTVNIKKDLVNFKVEKGKIVEVDKSRFSDFKTIKLYSKEYYKLIKQK
ncbi:MAG: biotin/lipoate A/B protein ligase family protein [Candidatus Izemoplasmatales bacterium]